MTVIEIPDSEAAILKAKAAAEGLTLRTWLVKLATEETRTSLKPKRSGHGILAEHGLGPSEEEIDESRREMLSRFAEDFE